MSKQNWQLLGFRSQQEMNQKFSTVNIVEYFKLKEKFKRPKQNDRRTVKKLPFSFLEVINKQFPINKIEKLDIEEIKRRYANRTGNSESKN